MIRTILCKNTRGFGIKQILILISAFTLFSCVTLSKLFNFPLPFCTTCKIGIIPILIGCWEHWREYVKYWQRRRSISGTYYHCPFVVSEFLRTDSPFLSSIMEPGTCVTLCVSKGLWLKVPKQELNIRYEKERAGPGALENFTSVKDSVRPGWCSEKLDIARCNSHKDCGSRHQVQQYMRQSNGTFRVSLPAEPHTRHSRRWCEMCSLLPGSRILTAFFSHPSAPTAPPCQLLWTCTRSCFLYLILTATRSVGLFPFYRCGNWGMGMGRLSNLRKVVH